MKGLGKVDRDFLARTLVKNLGAKNESVIVGPGMGLDNAVISLGRGKVMVVTADPISIIPEIGMEDSAWLTVHEIASDLATSAVRPEFAVLDYNLPPSLSSEDFERYVKAVGKECAELGVAIVAGHTGRYPGSGFTVVGGGMMMGISSSKSYLTPAMVREGDDIIMTKGSAIEATAVLARMFPRTVEGELGKHAAKRAAGYFRLASTFEDAMVASSVGIRSEGVTSMHDATEGGVLGGLFELAQSSGRTLTVDVKKIMVSADSSAVCKLFGLDPLVTLSEGTLLIACRPHRSGDVVERLERRRIAACVVGSAGGRAGGRLMLREDGSKAREYSPPKFDGYWQAYANALEKKWK